MRTLETLSRKFRFIEADVMVKSSKALKDVQPEVERVRQKAVSKYTPAQKCLMFLRRILFLYLVPK
ncbi:hypothetical protein E2562_036556, partial [Oryza meyeriana var. granulata]